MRFVRAQSERFCDWKRTSYLFMCIHILPPKTKRCHVHVWAFAGLSRTCAVGPSTVNVIIGLPLLSNLVGVDEYDEHCDEADERHQHCRAQSCVDVWDEAPRGGMDRNVSVQCCFSVCGKQRKWKDEEGDVTLKCIKQSSTVSCRKRKRITCLYCSIFTQVKTLSMKVSQPGSGR